MSTPGLQNNLSLAERRRLRQQQQEAAGPKVTAELGELAPNPANPRNDLTKLDELADSFRRSGVAQALTVIPGTTFVAAFPEYAATVAPTLFVVVNGNRRLAAAPIAGLTQVPITINTTATTRTDILVLALAENIQREDLAPLEELETIETLKGLLDTYAAVATALGKSEGWVSQRRRLGNLAPELQDELRAGKLKIEDARELGKTKDHAAQRAARAAQLTEAAEKKKAGEKPKGRAAAKKKAATVPHQGGQQQPSESSTARRTACQEALTGEPADDTAVVLAALQVAVDPGSAQALAAEWLAAVGAGDTFHAVVGEEPRQAALALALARCELASTLVEGVPVREYVGWLVAHVGYEATADEQKLLGDPAFTP
ncbi:ParB/RepB/Spo0J family partition protein [Kitasatospora sp. NPDC049258]|uniref:ParB/RepB/Spo0J family partition protein n=1 Tax=Kitasatospora sp. NPDC049258 TaxID=3155394 RepID=UPI00342A7BF1